MTRQRSPCCFSWVVPTSQWPLAWQPSSRAHHKVRSQHVNILIVFKVIPRISPMLSHASTAHAFAGTPSQRPSPFPSLPQLNPHEAHLVHGVERVLWIAHTAFLTPHATAVYAVLSLMPNCMLLDHSCHCCLCKLITHANLTSIHATALHTCHTLWSFMPLHFDHSHHCSDHSCHKC
jgi:hypothetical protein